MKISRKAFGKILVFSFTVVLFCFLPFGLTYADPPPISCDTVYFEPFPGSDVSFDGNTLYTYPGDDVKININLKNIVTIPAFLIPLIDMYYDGNIFLDSAKNNGSPDPICFEGGRVEYWWGNIIKLSQYPHFLIVGGPCSTPPFPPCPGPLPPGDGPIITLTFTALDSGEIYLDTLVYHWGPKDNSLLLVHPDAIGYTPVFIPRTFSVRFCPYNPGDLNCDKNKDIIDVVFLLNYLFRGGEEPYPLESADVNCDQEVTVADVVYLISYIFRSGEPPQTCEY